MAYPSNTTIAANNSLKFNIDGLCSDKAKMSVLNDLSSSLNYFFISGQCHAKL